MRVPVYERQEGIAPLSGVRVSPAVPQGDFGAGIGRAVEQLAARVRKIQQDTEDARTLELFNNFRQESQDYHENPDKGIYNTRLGFKAQGVYSESDNWLRRKGEEYARQVRSPRAKGNFRRMAEQFIQQQGLQNSRFEAEQVKKYREETFQNSYRLSMDEVERNWDNPEAIEKAKQDIYAAAWTVYKDRSPEAWKAFHDDTEDQIAVARIRQAYQANPVGALALLDSPDIRLRPETQAKLRESLQRFEQQQAVYSAADRYWDSFGAANRQAREAVFSDPSLNNEQKDKVWARLKTRESEVTIEQNKAAQQKYKQQNDLEEKLEKDFYLNNKLPSDEEFQTMVADDLLRVEQVDRLKARRYAAVNISKIEHDILSANPDITPDELDIEVMRRLGVTDEDYRRTFADAAQGVLLGSVSDKTLDDLYRRRALPRADVENLKKRRKTFEDVQAKYYKSEYDNLKLAVEALRGDGFPQAYKQQILDRFAVEAATDLNAHSPSYREDLFNLRKKVLLDAIDNSGQRLKGYLWGNTRLGEQYANLQDSTFASRNVDPFPMLPAVSPSISNLGNNSLQPRAPLRGTPGNTGNIGLDMVSGDRKKITSRFSDSRSNGKRQHNAIDVWAPKGTPIVFPDKGLSMTVGRISLDPKSPGGISVRLDGKLPDGRNIEMKILHIDVDGVKVEMGQEVHPGDVIGLVGNTGNTSEGKDKKGKTIITAWRPDKKTGYHMHLQMKVNGKVVDPEKFQWPQKKLSQSDIFAIPAPRNSR